MCTIGAASGSRRTGNHFGSIPQEVEVSASVLYMSMSLDVYIAGRNDEPDNPGGDGFDRLHEWYGDFSRPSGPTSPSSSSHW